MWGLGCVCVVVANSRLYHYCDSCCDVLLAVLLVARVAVAHGCLVCIGTVQGMGPGAAGTLGCGWDAGGLQGVALSALSVAQEGVS